MKTAALVLAALAGPAPVAQAQLRLTRPAPWTPDSIVKAVVTGGSAQLTPAPKVDEGIPRIWLTRAERTQWKRTSDYEETVRYCSEESCDYKTVNGEVAVAKKTSAAKGGKGGKRGAKTKAAES